MITIKNKQLVIDGEELVVWVDSEEELNDMDVRSTLVQNCKIHVIVKGESNEIPN